MPDDAPEFKQEDHEEDLSASLTETEQAVAAVELAQFARAEARVEAISEEAWAEAEAAEALVEERAADG